jgi:predicted secreted hydrolase
MNKRWIYCLLSGLALGVGLFLWRDKDGAPDRVASVLRDSASNAGYARVLEPREFGFPRDHGAHPAYRHEWWYVTGHLSDADGRRHGFQLTFFRYGLNPASLPSTSRWRSNQALLAHFALSDLAQGEFLTRQRQSRIALGTAGVDEARAEVWIRDWFLRQGSAPGEWQLGAAYGLEGLSLRLTETKPLVLQGDRGYSRKSAEPGNASYYYSLPRLSVEGSLSRGGQQQAVTGTAWLDHEWGTSALGADQQGWDWFAVQLNDGRELSFYRLRSNNNVTDPHSHGMLVGRDGAVSPLSAKGVVMTPRRWWRSPVSGARYPVVWRVEVPDQNLDLELSAAFDPQEWHGPLRYWEGAVNVKCANNPGADCGRGYLELTGYGAGAPQAQTTKR